MRAVGRATRFGWAFARVLDAQERGDHQHRPQAAGSLRGHQHARQLHVHRQACHLLADGGHAPLGVDRAQFGQLLPAIGHRTLVRRFQERELFDAAQAQLQHAQDHPGQAGAADFRIGELGPRLEIGLGVQAVADTLGDTAAATLALIGASLRDRLDVQTVQLVARTVALDAGKARIDHVADAWHRQRGFRHIRGQHDAAVRAGVEHPVLVLVGQARVQRQHLGIAVLAAFQRLVRIADLALARQEDQHVAARIQTGDFVDGRHDGVVDGALALLLALAFQRAVAHFHRVGAAFNADHRRIVEMLGEAFGVDGGRSDDQLQVRALAQQLLQVAQQEVDVEAAFVRLVDDDRVVVRQPAVTGDFRQQDAVGHELDAAVFADLVVEAHLVADQLAQFALQFLRHAAGHRTCSNPSRLGAADHAGLATACGQAQFRQLGGLARAGFTSDHHDLVVADQPDDGVGFTRNRQLRVQSNGRLLLRPCHPALHRRLQGLLESGGQCRILWLGLATREHPQQTAPVAAHGAVDGGALLAQAGRWIFIDRVHQSVRSKL